jgi:predicted regulator of Ras-like GTPase activity (Roadblock/LC7/MglB family)
VKTPAQAKFRDVLEGLREKFSDVHAILMVGPDGVMDHLLLNTTLSIEMIAGEYEALLRIAARTSEDAGAGHMVEHIVVSEKSIMIARSIAKEHFLILLSGKQDQMGRLRYELKQAAREVERRISS